MQGYTSTSKSFEIALKFAFTEIKLGQISVVYKIDFFNDKGLFDMTGFSSFNEEREVLVQDGLEYSVTDIKEQKLEEMSYYLISLRHPAVAK